jgi:hypothetical protein
MRHRTRQRLTVVDVETIARRRYGDQSVQRAAVEVMPA